MAGSLAGLDEDELLDRFVRGQGCASPRNPHRAARAHGPGRAAAHLLADPNDVEDAFQATFLVLIRKAETIRRPGSLASWLHGVAHRTAVRLKRPSRTIRLMTDPAERPHRCPVEDREQTGHLHREIERLPEKYRLPIVLCYLEGLTHDDAAAQLRWPVGTVRGRLARARDRLRERLSRNGVELCPGSWLSIRFAASTRERFPENCSGRPPPYSNKQRPLRVSTLTKGVVLAMIVDKLKWTLATLAVATVIARRGRGGAAGSRQPGSSVEKHGVRAFRQGSGLQFVKNEGTQVAAEREEARISSRSIGRRRSSWRSRPRHSRLPSSVTSRRSSRSRRLPIWELPREPVTTRPSIWNSSPSEGRT